MATGRLPDPNSSPLTAKGDLYTYSTVPAKLAVGNNGETLVADSSATTGLRWQGNFAAGKNAILNGDFRINQRGFSSSTAGDFVFDRWASGISGGTVTSSAQTFTAGTAPVAGYEAINFYRIVTTGQSAAGDFALIRTRLEDSRLFANQTVTISFWAKANSGTPKVAVEVQQNFGSGGSTAVNTYAGQVTLSTSWSRYSVTVAVPSISGKTLGTGNYFEPRFWVSAGTTYDARTGSLGIQTNTFDFWGMQLEAGSVATPFQTATGTLAGELAACQRYYYRETADTTYAYFGFGMATATTNGKISIPAPVTMRVVPTSIDAPTASTLRFTDGVTGTACNAAPTLDGDCTNEMLTFNVGVASGLTQYRPVWFGANNSSSAYIGFSAEL